MDSREMLKRLIEHNEAREAQMRALLAPEEPRWIPPKAVLARKILLDDGVRPSGTLWRLAEVMLDFKLPVQTGDASILEKPDVQAWRPAIWDAYVPLACKNGHSYRLGYPLIVTPQAKTHQGAGLDGWNISPNTYTALTMLAMPSTLSHGNWINISPEEILSGNLRIATEAALWTLSDKGMDWLTSEFPEK